MFGDLPEKALFVKQHAGHDVSRLMELPVLLELVGETLQGALVFAFLWIPCVYFALRFGGTRGSRKVFIAFLVLECLAIALYGRWVFVWIALYDP